MTTAGGTDSSMRFVLLVRALASAARDMGLVVPHFQSPPRSKHLDRSIQRRSREDCVIAVRIQGRPFGAVVADAVEGIVYCNDLQGEAAAQVRSALEHTAAAVKDDALPARRSGA